MTAPRQPGDLILDRYMPNASDEEREVARENLRLLARLLVQKSERIAHERSEQAAAERHDPMVNLK